jgi:hypothetical protein
MGVGGRRGKGGKDRGGEEGGEEAQSRPASQKCT